MNKCDNPLQSVVRYNTEEKKSVASSVSPFKGIV